MRMKSFIIPAALLPALLLYFQTAYASNPPKLKIMRQAPNSDPSKIVITQPENIITRKMPSFEPKPGIDYEINEMPIDKNIHYSINELLRQRKETIEKAPLKNLVKPNKTEPLPLIKPQLGPFKSPRNRSPLLPLPKLKQDR